ncbi:3-phosphoshikimate 1-carboxyvinyltransferase [Flavobacterium silvaticum]|uniref:3-phosphoshikimate 1-carboxyvinyltransferase n=1 Tax=Flavobacterium silvaticum TaxID=1852020 RepID=A0A972JHL2_9FLAO|nr:3-phosphoshikimate 1-carboxyvinyltransferase [Flavobacterium silvaticum]NMH27253.1 3-phosphoshikimate 1-carboxyvinyltransferase [Flavobacterium silvaticum]
MFLRLSRIPSVKNESLKLSGSKSETNRLLLLQALFPSVQLQNTSDSDDSIAMKEALASSGNLIDVHHAGTAMRFLTAYFASAQGKSVVITGSDRMKQRPVGLLVDALRQLGADIEYENADGFPPLRINGKKLSGSKVSLQANVSSQFISALLLIAPSLPNGIELELLGEITSVPYINMTLSLLRQVGVEASFTGNIIKVKPQNEIGKTVVEVESDWSSASYFFSIVALSPIGTSLQLRSFRKDSFQGDSELVRLYEDFGVASQFSDTNLTLTKTGMPSEQITFDLNKTPDIAQTIVVTAFGLGLNCNLTGLHTLKIKETDRLEALKTELTKLGANISVTSDSLSLSPSAQINSGISIDTYNDHRMAMAFAPLALRTAISINNAEVVSKSYPAFWDDLEKIGFTVDANQ